MNCPKNIEEIKKFAKEIGIDVKYLLGEKYDGCLDLRSVETLPSNIVFNVGGFMWLTRVQSLPDNIVFNVGGSLVLHSVQYLPSSTIFTVDGNIYLPAKHKVKVIW